MLECPNCGDPHWKLYGCVCNNNTPPRRPWVASCHHCRQTWDGSVAPASLMCPECGEALEVEDD